MKNNIDWGDVMRRFENGEYTPELEDLEGNKKPQGLIDWQNEQLRKAASSKSERRVNGGVIKQHGFISVFIPNN